MVHVVLVGTNHEERVHRVHARGADRHQDLAVARLGDGNLADGAIGSKLVDGVGTHGHDQVSLMSWKGSC